MKKVLLTLLAMGTMFAFANAEEVKSAAPAEKPKKMTKMFQTVPMDKATILQEGKTKMFCPECGMTLPMFYKTNHAATVDGKVKQYCSIYCIVEDTKKGSKLTDIKVVDVKSLKFINADKAFYVVGSSKKGTMTMVSKYAFASKVDAEAFAKENGGKVMNYEGAYKAAEADFGKDSKMVNKKQSMMAEKGEMMYGKMCQKTDQKFATTAEAKAFIMKNNLCKGLNPKQLQAVGLYLKGR
ncbi:MAG: nitrous oxide reductase accessory protein NosL [Campylobacterota bacterium]|nr:nitrous oxide reductase accessory protein NosL [Campylobacterota bacterium]